jgi:hypothetical protein
MADDNQVDTLPDVEFIISKSLFTMRGITKKGRAFVQQNPGMFERYKLELFETIAKEGNNLTTRRNYTYS